MKNPVFVKCNSKTVKLKPILEKWCSINRRFLKEAESDCPWWYNERASVSILASAAWASGHIALEEYVTKKGRRKNDKEWPGRCDLKIKVNSSNYLFEAKQQWAMLSKKSGKVSLKETRDKILKSLDSARRDSGKLKSRAGRRFGISFVVPRISETEEGRLDERLDELLYLLKEKRKRYDAIAWFFAKKKDRPRKKERIYPGVVLLIKEVRRLH